MRALAGPQGDTRPLILKGNRFNLNIGYQPVNFTGKNRVATVVNGSVPGPTLHWQEGDRVTLRVTNHLAYDSSIHWHGMILPTNMDGVPGLSYPGIRPGETYEFQFDVKQNGTFWYHSHSKFQEQTGLYGAIVIAPRQADPVSYDRDYVVLLSDWTDEDPVNVYAKLKKQSDYYNFRERTALDLWRDIREKGVMQTWNTRSMWNRVRMSDRDISDVTGYTYTFLMNGQTPADPWTRVIRSGEKVRLRFINGSAMTLFDVRIPGLTMAVVAADGQNIEPVSVDEFRIGVAETYDVIVKPESDMAYSVFAQAIDRTGYARGTLTTDPSLTADVPSMDPAPILNHGDMGMAMNMNMNHVGMGHGMDQMEDTRGMDHAMGQMGHMQGMEGMQGMDHSQNAMAGKAGFGSARPVSHVASEYGVQVDMRADNPQYQLDDPGVGLRNSPRRVLTYADICNLYRTLDPREPGREIELHLTGNMSRYMWSINGIKYADAEPIRLNFGERVRITLVNDTMMNHPIHLHGMWSELETGEPDYIPRKHVVIAQPGAKVSYLVTADAKGRWAYHCHLLYHMLGMFREVRVG